MPYRWFPFVLCSSVALAQGAPTFVTKSPLARVRIENVSALLAQLPATCAGQLLANDEVAAAWSAGLARFRERAARRTEIVAAVRRHRIALDPWLSATVRGIEAWDTVRSLELTELQRCELAEVGGDDELPLTRTIGVVACQPRAEGRWTRLFEEQARRLAADPTLRAVADAKFEGLPVHEFEPVADAAGEREEGALDDARQRSWLLHLPGVFAFGAGSAATSGALAPPPPRRPEAGFGAEVDLAANVARMGRLGGVPAEFAAIGLDRLQALRWRLRFAGPLVLDELEVEANGEPRGIVGALLTGKGTPPAQPLPDRALAQLRCSVDVAMLLDGIAGAAGGGGMPDELRATFQAAFPGGIAIGVCAPAPGGVLPRVIVSLAIGDADAVTKVIDELARARMPRTEFTCEGVPCVALKVDDLPQGLQPAWCRVDGVLHVAESAASLRALLKARAAAAPPAMDVGDAPLPEGAGDAVPGFELRYDAAALYGAFHAHWLPLLNLIPGDVGRHALVRADELPEPDAVAALLGQGRALLRRNGTTWTLQQLGPLGGVHTTALAFTWAPLLSASIAEEWSTQQLERHVASAQLAPVWTELEAFREKHQRWPRDLGELFTATKLPADALLLPGDTNAEPVALPAGDARTIRSSFRWFAPPVQANVDGGDVALLLVGITPRPAFRPMLTDKGDVPQTWGEICQRPIEQFGK
jgi:hypothetical protein